MASDIKFDKDHTSQHDASVCGDNLGLQYEENLLWEKAFNSKG